MNDQQKQDEFDQIVVEDAASEPTGCLGQAMVLTVILVVLVLVLVAMETEFEGLNSVLTGGDIQPRVSVLTPLTTNALVLSL